MLRHIVLLHLADEATDDAVDAIIAALRELPTSVDGVLRLVAERDADLAEGNADLVLQVDFEDVAAWRAYSSHPAHKAIVADHIAPLLVSKSAAQIHLS